MIKQTCREYRVIPIVDLPKYIDPLDMSERAATVEELAGFGIFEFDRGATNAQVLTVGYYCPDRDCGVDRFGGDWPGEVIAGKKGIYGAARCELIKQSLLAYKSGVNGGRTRLMQTGLAKESAQSFTVNGTTTNIPAVVLSDPESERLAARLPRIMGDS